MQRSKLNFNKCRANLSRLAVAILLMGYLPTRSIAQQPGQKTFSSAQGASDALVAAAQSKDQKALLDILGSDGKQVISSGDNAEDVQNLENFVQRYRELHRLVREPDGTTTLYVGAENWPMPIPLVNRGNLWYFDTPAGKDEILYRRIGRNEISALHVCQQLVAAEKEYYSAHNNQYAQKMLSDEGQQNGLYWKAAKGQPQSPIGPLVASATGSQPTPYRGYFYSILTRQGATAPGGAKSYIVNGKMTEGFAFVAYPAEYKSSGVMTFIVDKDGVVYRKDLGQNTPDFAKAIKEYNPDSTWKKDEDQQVETAAKQKNQLKRL